LGAVYKEMGEPGKEEVSKNKKKKNVRQAEVPYEKMPIQRLGGAVVYAREGDQVYLALVHDIFGHWTLSKGKLEGDEDVKDGTRREIKEEIGLDILIQDELFLNEYIANDPEKGKIRKQVQYFLGESKFDEVVLEKSGGLDDARWFKLADILTLNFYDDVLPIVTKAINILLIKQD
jgi:8-oxo-dGTP pyrophosphatase MutT (NUDIX family)